MTSQIKYLVFKGIAKKEEILFRSFLNLAKNELPYQVVVLKANLSEIDQPDIVIIDESYELKESEQYLLELPTITVGDDHSKQHDYYIARPVQWSEFKYVFTKLDVGLVGEVESNSRVLPIEVSLAIAEVDEEKSETGDNADDLERSGSLFSDEGEYEYELDKMSIDYHSFTNSDYIKVIDDVKQYHMDDLVSVPEQHLLVTDDESSYASSVLVIETNTMDAWDFSQPEFSTSQISENAIHQFEEPDTEEIVLKQRAGFEVKPDEEYWLEENEIIIDNKSFLFIKPEREMVYSHIDPGRWPALLQRRALFKVPLPDGWRPEQGMQVHPLSSFLWVNTLINETEYLAPELDENTDYLLERWPPFDLLEFDNVLLKLCTMLFVKPVSAVSLAAKSGYAQSTVMGLMNACHEMGYLAEPEQIDADKKALVRADEGMLGKIKDVFR